VLQGAGEERAKAGTEGALHTGLHHVGAPEQQGDGAGEGQGAESDIHLGRVLQSLRDRVTPVRQITKSYDDAPELRGPQRV
jgi:hypothetical protein